MPTMIDGSIEAPPQAGAPEADGAGAAARWRFRQPTRAARRTLRRWRIVRAGAAALLLLLAVGAAALIWSLRATALSSAERDLRDDSTQVATRVGQTLRIVDLGLRDLVNRVELEAARAGTDVLPFLNSDTTRRLLETELRHLRIVDALALANAQGEIVNRSGVGLARSVSLAGRDYFQELRRSASNDLTVTGPYRSLIRNESVLIFSRRLSFDGSSFDGVATAAAPLPALEEMIRQSLRSDAVEITLRRADGLLITHVPARKHPLGTPDASDRSVLLAHAVADETLVVSASMCRSDALAAWHRQAVAIVAVAASVIACLGILVHALLRRVDEQRRSRRALLRRNRDLLAMQGTLRGKTSELEAVAAALRGSERMLSERSDMLDKTLANIVQGILMVNGEGHVVVYNRQVTELLDIPESLLAKEPTVKELLRYQLERGEFDGMDQTFQGFMRVGDFLEDRPVYRRVRPNGRVIEFNTIVIPGGGAVRTYTDVTELTRAQESIERAALFDSLTGLPNRLALQGELERCRQEASALAPMDLYCIDIDRFRLLNDARGHDAGDKILVEVARRLAAAVAPSFVARTGGDEFAVLVRQSQAQEQGSSLGLQLLATLAEPIVADDWQVSLTASIGVAQFSSNDDTKTPPRNAEIAMYQAKDAGRNRLCRFEAGMADLREERFQIEQSLRRSLGSTAFRVSYQPIVSVATRQIAGFEALLRWTDPQRGEVSPNVFIPIAEATGLILPLGRWVLEQACQEAAGWPDGRIVAVNLSPAQLLSGTLPQVVADILAKTGLPARRLELEVTEGMLIEDTTLVHQTMVSLRNLGVALALDDFGTGHAGLSTLLRFPFTKIKVDRSFIRNLGRGTESDVIVDQVLSLARRMNVSIVAEGVETEAQFAFLRELGCTYVQGFLTGRPEGPEVTRTL